MTLLNSLTLFNLCQHDLQIFIVNLNFIDLSPILSFTKQEIIMIFPINRINIEKKHKFQTTNK
jgi:hypothetical protein